MKKLIFVFVALFILVLISGCNARNNNTVRFDENSADITSENTEKNNEESTEITSSEEDVTTAPVVKKPSGKLEVTSFDSAFLKTSQSEIVVEGGTSSDTHTIKINDYTLKKYIPGQNEWSYIASNKYGTLKPGSNNYVIKTYDKSGKQIDSLMFTIQYDAPTPEVLPSVGANHWLILFFAFIMSGSYAIFRKFRWL